MSDLTFLTAWMITEAVAVNEFSQGGLSRVRREGPTLRKPRALVTAVTE